MSSMVSGLYHLPKQPSNPLYLRLLFVYFVMSGDGSQMKRYTKSMLAQADLVCRTWISPKVMPPEEFTAIGATLEMGQAVWTMSGEVVPKTKTDNPEAHGLLAVWPGTLHGLRGEDDLIVCYKGETEKFVHPRKQVLCKTVDWMVALANDVVPDSDIPPSDHSTDHSEGCESDDDQSNGTVATPKKKKQRKNRKVTQETNSGNGSDNGLANQPNPKRERPPSKGVSPIGKKRRGATLTQCQVADILAKLQSGSCDAAVLEELKDATLATVKDIISQLGLPIKVGTKDAMLLELAKAAKHRLEKPLFPAPPGVVTYKATEESMENDKATVSEGSEESNPEQAPQGAVRDKAMEESMGQDKATESEGSQECDPQQAAMWQKLAMTRYESDSDATSERDVASGGLPVTPTLPMSGVTTIATTAAAAAAVVLAAFAVAVVEKAAAAAAVVGAAAAVAVVEEDAKLIKNCIEKGVLKDVQQFLGKNGCKWNPVESGMTRLKSVPTGLQAQLFSLSQSLKDVQHLPDGNTLAGWDLVRVLGHKTRTVKLTDQYGEYRIAIVLGSGTLKCGSQTFTFSADTPGSIVEFKKGMDLRVTTTSPPFHVVVFFYSPLLHVMSNETRMLKAAQKEVEESRKQMDAILEEAEKTEKEVAGLRKALQNAQKEVVGLRKELQKEKEKASQERGRASTLDGEVKQLVKENGKQGKDIDRLKSANKQLKHDIDKLQKAKQKQLEEAKSDRAAAKREHAAQLAATRKVQAAEKLTAAQAKLASEKLQMEEKDKVKAEKAQETEILDLLKKVVSDRSVAPPNATPPPYSGYPIGAFGMAPLTMPMYTPPSHPAHPPLHTPQVMNPYVAPFALPYGQNPAFPGF